MYFIQCIECNKQFYPTTKKDIYCYIYLKDILCYLYQHKLEDNIYEEYTTCYAKSCIHCYQIVYCNYCKELKCNNCMEEKPSACCLECFLDDDVN